MMNMSSEEERQMHKARDRNIERCFHASTRTRTDATDDIVWSSVSLPAYADARMASGIVRMPRCMIYTSLISSAPPPSLSLLISYLTIYRQRGNYSDGNVCNQATQTELWWYQLNSCGIPPRKCYVPLH